MNRTIVTTTQQEQVLAVYATRSKKTVDQLITNFLEGWIGQLAPDAAKEEVDVKFDALPVEAKKKAVELYEASLEVTVEPEPVVEPIEEPVIK